MSGAFHASAPAAALTEIKSVVPFSSRLRTGRALATDVWSIYNAANLPSDCINLGQGYMNFLPPAFVREAAEVALAKVQTNHYAHPKGNPRLRRAINSHYGPSFQRDLDPETEILVTSGANEGQYSVFTAFLEQGDEVIMFEPYFDQYLPSITFNGGVPIYVPLHPPLRGQSSKTANDWTIDFDELRRAITPKTKIIIVNTPHNPVGKVFSLDELTAIANIAKEFNLLVMADEVYDCMVFDDKSHIRIANLPDMWERTVTVGSAGKSFAATGWRIGWLIGPPSIIAPTLAASTRIVFSSNAPMQEAVAIGLEQAQAQGYFEKQLREYQERRDTFVKYFDQLGLAYCLPYGSYFLLADISDIAIPEDYDFPASLDGRGKDFKACWFIAQAVGVSSIPPSEFYCLEHQEIGERFARFAFCKDLDTLNEAGRRLQNLKKYIKKSSANS